MRNECSGKSPKAVRCFWIRVSTKINQNMELSAVVDVESGTLKCARDEIKEEVEKHLCRTFRGSMEPVEKVERGVNMPSFAEQHVQEHSYGVSQRPALCKVNDSAKVNEDPGGWMDRNYTLEEIRKSLKKMKGGKAKGHDFLPNEFLINAPDELLVLIVSLFNMIKKEGRVPKDWNKGIITLIFKKGLREMLKNYRPVTVIISLSGLYSRVLNERLEKIVEGQGLLGEDQQGFRKGRRMGDNSFLLDTVLWKSRAMRKDVHLAYVDISKAYDTVDRDILWDKLERMGIGGQFLKSLQGIYSGDCVEAVVNGSTTRPVYLRRGLRQGCSLSPLLFALYISDIGREMTASPSGVEIGGLRVCALLFADDIALIARTSLELKGLIKKVKNICNELKLQISLEKSQIVSPEGEGDWDIMDDRDEILSLKSVLSYKYLGTETTLLMSSTGSKKQKKCVRTAQRYRYACHYVGRTGPDMIDVVLATWNNIAIPTILSGCEVIPFTEETIEAIESEQVHLAKRLLNLPKSTPNVCVQTELGMKPFRLVLYQHQLSFYLRAMQLPKSRWVSIALEEHLSGGWDSPYMSYIAKIRRRTGLLDMAPTMSFLGKQLESWSLQEVNGRIDRLSCVTILPMKSFLREVYVCEGEGIGVLAAFRLGSAGLGNREPGKGQLERKSQCQLCYGVLNEMHVAFTCSMVEDYRKKETDISFFRNVCRRKNIPVKQAYRRYVTGYDWNGIKVLQGSYAMRGAELKGIVKYWQSLLGYIVY